jgi:hypothetical protein
VPEVWRGREDRVTIFVLEAGAYIEADASRVLPPLRFGLGGSFPGVIGIASSLSCS